MQKNSFTRFIEGAGGCIVSKRILSGESPVKWMFREKSVNEIDNGWRFFSSMDDDDYVNNVNNLAVCDFNTVANIEPLVLGYYTFPVGSDLQLAGENGKTDSGARLAENDGPHAASGKAGVRRGCRSHPEGN